MCAVCCCILAYRFGPCAREVLLMLLLLRSLKRCTARRTLSHQHHPPPNHSHTHTRGPSTRLVGHHLSLSLCVCVCAWRSLCACVSWEFGGDKRSDVSRLHGCCIALDSCPPTLCFRRQCVRCCQGVFIKRYVLYAPIGMIRCGLRNKCMSLET